MKFLNPYHWVPVVNPSYPLKTSDFKNGEPPNVTHDRYVAGTHSGRIVCRVKTVTPIFIGSQKKPGSSQGSEISPYTLHNKRAIPATSLRGMISSIIEAASNSALRVMDFKREYSVRKPIDRPYPLSALGIVILGSDGHLHLQPLCIPTLHADRNGVATLSPKFRSLFPQPNMKVYIGNRNSIRNSTFLYRTLDLKAPQWYGMKLKPRSWGPGFTLPDDNGQHRKPATTRMFVLSQIPSDPALAPWSEIPAHANSAYTVGALRVLGCSGNRADIIPTGKTHELFIPWPASKTWPVVRIPDQAVADFNEMAKERYEASCDANKRNPQTVPLLPLEPKGRARPNGELKLQHGDIVYFDVDDKGRISEVSFSAIWRKPVTKFNLALSVRAGVGDFFHPDLLPFQESRPSLSTAELLLGFAEQREKREEGSQQANTGLALAGRVNFSTALTEKEPTIDKPVLLKILDSPKPPSPALYFHPRHRPNGGFIKKVELNSADHEANGRKFYLHQKPDKKPWQSHSPDANREQQSTIAPMTGEFFFTVDFDNLSDEELGLLLYALKPAPQFRHKIGMGKSIGLGSIEVDPLQIGVIDRQQRYSLESANPRFHYAELQRGFQADEIPEALRIQASGSSAGKSLFSLKEKFRNSMDQRIRTALEAIGDPGTYGPHPVKQPVIEGESEEDKTFRWFVANESGLKEDGIDAQHQYLSAITSSAIPPLEQPRRRR